MRIAMLSPISWRTPPRDYGPWELVTSLLTEGLVEQGVDVTLFATADSQTKGGLVAVCPRGYSEEPEIDPKVWECLHISELFERADEFDLIHNQFDFLPLTYSRLVKTPVVTTIHGFSSPKIVPVFKKYNNSSYYVAISEADRNPELDYIATIHHGIDLKRFTLREESGEYLLFFGRIHRDKGTREAIEIARKSGMKLIIAGIIQDREYYNKEVAPHIDGRSVVFVGPAGPKQRDKLLGEAYAVLHTINFEEPFGLSVIESMACGTPVIAFNKGSMPELIRHGKNGFLVSDVEEAVSVVPSVKDVNRRYCRLTVEENFSPRRMVDEYVRVYKKIISLRKREDCRPWGRYEVLSEARGHKVKRITVLPGQRLSLQSHQHRAEHWVVASGRAIVTLGSENIPLNPGDCVDIPEKKAHRVRNPGSEPLVFIEVQRGNYLGEDDIIRYEDDYGR